MRDVIRIVSCLVSGAISRRHLSDNWTETAAASPWRLNRNKREKDIRGLFYVVTVAADVKTYTGSDWKK